jgi:hypothetical protein
VAVSDWLPIKTAPKDRKVLLGWPIDGVKPGKIEIGIFGGQAWPSHFGVRCRHWMPLPSLPDGDA